MPLHLVLSIHTVEVLRSLTANLTNCRCGRAILLSPGSITSPHGNCLPHPAELEHFTKSNSSISELGIVAFVLALYLRAITCHSIEYTSFHRWVFRSLQTNPEPAQKNSRKIPETFRSVQTTWQTKQLICYTFSHIHLLFHKYRWKWNIEGV